ncbi:MAG: nucleotidyltransferase substrate binding protein [Pseudomonadota bacterium]|nr:nucleotidyltransferase substrate binding protein [Pseudomonadota bacterium]MDP1905210.1 nucleotidyltransferase substrate binding protein [Pseudomonadota bacterium]MDP2352772.1 nucleotidyltransferase substrate binding protein [Pseudomonadota bacterium]
MLYLNTNHLKRCIETLEMSLRLYHKAEGDSVDQEVFRNAVVKGYELAQEAAFKLLRKALKEYGHGGQKLNSLVVREVLRLAAQHGLMTLEEVERWFVYRANRNNTAHDYGEGFAKETLALLPGFMADIGHLAEVLDAHFGPGHAGT